ncbi:MAG: recombination mediator RecR [Patescibacteria group bacterium]|jgi:recombination protein RecR
MKYPPAVQNLIDKLSALPSVGPKTAERYVFYLLKQKEDKLKELAAAISELQEKIITCRTCGAWAETNPCPICADPNRSREILCVVENSQDLAAIESTRQYRGKYFVLDGLVDTIKDIQPSDLKIDRLADRIKKGEVKEIILALNFTMEGETTALYLTRLFKDHIKITRLARGLPAGSDLEYADELTLSNALKYRNEVKN